MKVSEQIYNNFETYIMKQLNNLLQNQISKTKQNKSNVFERIFRIYNNL